MKVYTGSGDKGKTSLFSGERITKSDRRIAAYGDVDELNSILGMLTSVMPESLAERRAEVLTAQSDLLHVGAWLATTPGAAAADSLKPFDENHAAALEGAIDAMDAALPPLTQFVLPGGHMTAAWAHVARTVCRRAERHVVAAVADQPAADTTAKTILVYLNRLSDYLFVLARFCNHALGVAEARWNP
ncbi:MAG: cob(I)yrinic acid a,c-diamide adenosyltransferase [Pseudomonadota bacterium]